MHPLLVRESVGYCSWGDAEQMLCLNLSLHWGLQSSELCAVLGLLAELSLAVVPRTTF